MDRSHKNQEAKAGHGPNISHHLLDILLRTPIALSHTILCPVNISMMLEHVVTIPSPKQDDQTILPDQPGQHNLLAQ